MQIVQDSLHALLLFFESTVTWSVYFYQYANGASEEITVKKCDESGESYEHSLYDYHESDSYEIKSSEENDDSGEYYGDIVPTQDVSLGHEDHPEPSKKWYLLVDVPDKPGKSDFIVSFFRLLDIAFRVRIRINRP